MTSLILIMKSVNKLIEIGPKMKRGFWSQSCHLERDVIPAVYETVITRRARIPCRTSGYDDITTILAQPSTTCLAIVLKSQSGMGCVRLCLFTQPS
jgi:hypothetical protein